MAPKRGSLRRRPVRETKTFGQKLLDFIRALVAFVFSNVGIVCLIVGYTILGAFLFSAIEETRPPAVIYKFEEIRHSIVRRLWFTTVKHNTFTEESWRENVTSELIKFQAQVLSSVQAGFYDETGTVRNRWTFSASFLYSLTVITTIGYGNITPATEWGKFATIAYAIGGMPIFLLFLTNIGTLLAKSCKYTYAKCFLCDGWEPERMKRNIRDQLDRDTPSPESIDTDMQDGSKEDGASISTINASEIDPQTITVPVSICLAIMIGYVCGGAILFAKWENWELLDGAYFCFISLSTIGFGDLVPSAMIKSEDGKIEVEFVFCSTYLLLGMALIAMCFNLMQEEVVHKSKTCLDTIQRILRIKT